MTAILSRSALNRICAALEAHPIQLADWVVLPGHSRDVTPAELREGFNGECLTLDCAAARGLEHVLMILELTDIRPQWRAASLESP